MTASKFTIELLRATCGFGIRSLTDFGQTRRYNCYCCSEECSKEQPSGVDKQYGRVDPLIMRRRSLPADKQEEAVKTLVMQVELMCGDVPEEFND